MDEKEEFLSEMWKHWEPYNEGGNGKWKSYILSNSAKDVLETDEECVTVCKGENGLYLS
jgi:hypothetical protein